MNKSILAVILGMPLAFCSCNNTEQVFPDFDYQTIYFANQTPVQTITLGEDGEFDVTMDNEHRFQILACVGGINTNKSNRWAEYRIDNSLVDGIVFADGKPVKALPASHYQITSDPNRLYINKGSVLGGIDIKLTDAFFADPDAADQNNGALDGTYACYVIPVRLVEASDSILNGEAKDGIAAPNVLNASDWNILPQNYTLYGIKYKNRWHGCWLSRGTVETDNNGTKSTVTHQNEYWENEELHYLTTKSLGACNYVFSNAVPTTDASGTLGETVLKCNVVLNINESTGEITCTSGTEGCTVTGSGKWEFHGAGKAWGTLDRDKITLDFTYSIPYTVNEKTGVTGTYTAHVTETLVSRDRQNKFETFTYELK